MKKYVKPQIYFESFELTESIAGNCTVIMNQTNEETCKMGTTDEDDFPGLPPMLMFTNTEVCGDNTINDDYCYWNGEATFRGFCS